MTGLTGDNEGWLGSFYDPQVGGDYTVNATRQPNGSLCVSAHTGPPFLMRTYSRARSVGAGRAAASGVRCADAHQLSSHVTEGTVAVRMRRRWWRPIAARDGPAFRQCRRRRSSQ
jgi:hypothetical protein